MTSREIICDNFFDVECKMGEVFDILTRSERLEAVYDNLEFWEAMFIFLNCADADFKSEIKEIDTPSGVEAYFSDVVHQEIENFINGDTPPYLSLAA